MENTSVIDKIIKIMFVLSMILGITLTLVYIFYTSTALLTSDSVITDVLAHQQVLNHQILLSSWYYGNEFWLFSLSIPTLLLSFFIKDNLLLRQISVLITAVFFFILLYQVGKKFIGKKETFVLVTIFLTGVSYSLLDYFYAFNAYLTVVINSMFLLYLYYKSFEESNKRIYYILSLLFTFLFNMGSLRYLPSVTISFLVTELILLVIHHKGHNISKMVKKSESTIKKLLGLFLCSIFAFFTFSILTGSYHYEQRAGSMYRTSLSGESITRKLGAAISCVHNFFGYDNKNHPLVFLTGKQYFVDNHKEAPFFSFLNFTILIKIITCILFMVITPIMLYKNYKKNSKKINFLLVFNTVSWFTMIYLYVFSPNFFYHYSELKYFIFNIILSIILGIYFLYQWFAVTKGKKYMVHVLILFYLFSNLYTTAWTIKDHDRKVMKEKLELVQVLKKNKLTFGYGGFWNGLLTYYLSDYKIMVASVDFDYGYIKPYRWYSDESWYQKNHAGRTFIILDQISKLKFDYYKDRYSKPDEILKCKGFYIYVYNKNPLLESWYHNKYIRRME